MQKINTTFSDHDLEILQKTFEDYLVKSIVELYLLTIYSGAALKYSLIVANMKPLAKI